MATRRELLAGTAATLILGGAVPWAIAETIAPDSPDPFDFPIIDAHCHVFNADDLSVRGFLRRSIFQVFEEDVPADCGQNPGWWDRLVGRPARKEAARILSRHMRGAVPAAKEAADLRLANESRTKVSGWTGSRKGTEDPVAKLLSDYFGDDKGGSRDADEDPVDPAGREELARFIESQIGQSSTQGAASSTVARTAGEVSRKLGWEEDEPRTEVGRTFAWAERLKKPRAELASILSALYGGPQKKVRLHAPALVDYAYWLNDHPRSTFKDQVAAMEQASIYLARNEGVLFHGYAAFDPLRDYLDPNSSFDLVMDAVENRGFIGTKLYPPMGFKALGNGSDPAMTFPSHVLFDKSGAQVRTNAEVGAALDAHLEKFYDWCAKNSVPILSHAYDSYGAGPCYGRRADPANWAAVAAKFPGIKVCLAHLGEFKNAATPGTDPLVVDLRRLDQTWEWNFGRLIETGTASNFFADVSDYSQVIHSKGTDDLRKAFVAFVKRFPFLRDRLIYGSDWILMDREENKKNHMLWVYKFMERVFRDAGNDQATTKDILHGIFYRNAVRFLGIDPGKPKENVTGQRLLLFHKRNDVHPDGPIGSTFLDPFRLS